MYLYSVVRDTPYRRATSATWISGSAIFSKSPYRLGQEFSQRPRIHPNHAHQQIDKGRGKSIGRTHEERIRVHDGPVEPVAAIDAEPGQEQGQGQPLPIQTSYHMDEPRGRQVGEDGHDEADAHVPIRGGHEYRADQQQPDAQGQDHKLPGAEELTWPMDNGCLNFGHQTTRSRWTPKINLIHR